MAVLALLVVPLLAGCAQEGPAPAGEGGQAAAVAGDVTRFEGWYRGQQVPVSFGANCRALPREVWFHVERGLIQMQTSRHRRSSVWNPILAGTLSPDGGVALRGTKSNRSAFGQIEGDRLTAADAPEAADLQDGKTVCAYRYEAMRQP